MRGFDGGEMALTLRHSAAGIGEAMVVSLLGSETL